MLAREHRWNAFAGRVRVIAVLATDTIGAMPTLEPCTRYRDTFGLTDHTTCDPEGRVAWLALDRYPATLLLDARGAIVARWEGYSQSVHDEMLRGIESLAGPPSPPTRSFTRSARAHLARSWHRSKNEFA